MTKFRVFNGKKHEREVLFKLVEGLDWVRVVACDANGKTLPGGIIISITPGGKLFLNADINPDLGLILTSEGTVEIGE